MKGGWDLPFEDIPDGPIHMDIVGWQVDQITVRAAFIETPVGKFPALVFSFSSSTGLEIPPITFVGEADNLQAVRAIVASAVKSAIKETKR